ncbi:protein dispatched [Anabrus simplex]|uniref:protein dispatched n=1 Tax=Anabrus simplex TaxID=316456 RepID=UPI0035A37666
MDNIQSSLPLVQRRTDDIVYSEGLRLGCDVGNSGTLNSDFINPAAKKNMSWFARIVTHHPYVILVAVAVFAGTCLVIPLTTKTLPNFSDPQLGFETRGTVISQRLTAWRNLIKETGTFGELTVNPKELPTYRDEGSEDSVSLEDVEMNGTVVAHKLTADEMLFTEVIREPTLQPKEFQVWKYPDNASGEYAVCQYRVSHSSYFIIIIIITHPDVQVALWRQIERPAPGEPSLDDKQLLQLVSSVSSYLKEINHHNVVHSMIAGSLCRQHHLEVYEDIGYLSEDSSTRQAHTIVMDRAKGAATVINPTVVEDELDDQYEEQMEEAKWTQLREMKVLGSEEHHHHHHHNHSHLSSDGFFCNSPSIDYSRVVFKSIGNADIFTLDSILAVCHLDRMLSTGHDFENLCQTITRGKCCRSWSLGNYIALLHNRTSCFDITKDDVTSTKILLKECASYFHNLQLIPDCPKNGNDFLCQQIPPQCSQYNAVYNIMYYLLDISFIPPNVSSSNSLSNAMLILPIACSSATLHYFQTLDVPSLRYGNVEVAALEFGLKNTLFDECLMRDTWMLGVGGTFVLVCMWLYTGSLFVTIMTFIAIGFSLGISYFMYTLVFELRFFPFMNLLASIVAVGIGADDAFIFCKVWQCAKAEKNNGTLVKLVHDTLRHAVLSMFVTSLTTAAAFYASYISSITAVGCFSIFAGTATLANFVLMMTWLPASVVVSEIWCCPPMMPSQWFSLDTKLRPARALADQARAMLDRLLVFLVLKLRYVWLLLLGGVAIGSIAVIFYHPRLKLPDTRDFQLFESQHPFERYDLIYKDRFWFERLQKADLNTKLPLRFVWGVLPVDNGDYLDPSSRGTLVFDPSFDMAAPESQAWLLNFCRTLRAQSFYQSTLGPLLPNCFIESFMSWMHRRCRDPSGIDRTPCCETAQFPYQRALFEKCIVHAIANLYETPVEIFIPGVAGPKFSKDPKKPHKIQAVVVEYDSNHSYSMSFTEMNHFYHQVETWMQSQLEHAPPGMRNGWFISDLEFYDLQLTLSEDTLIAIGVSMGIALVVLLLVTLNILISLYAVITITCIIFVTVAILVLLGWKLNVLESIAVSVAIGLAVDFSLHYGVHYRICPEGEDRIRAVSYAISRMGGPTVMAALTTAAAGAFMLPSSVLAYIQIGTFLVVVMLVSWIYSTFFLGALLSVAGPQRGFGQFSYPSPDRCCGGDSPVGGGGTGVHNREQTVYTNVLSESTLSTSSTVCPLHPSTSESHELEALSMRQSRHKTLCRSGSLSATLPSSSTVPLVPRVMRKVSLPVDQSPSAASATTIVLADDVEMETHSKEDPLLGH